MGVGRLKQWLWNAALESRRLPAASDAQQPLAVVDMVHQVIPAVIGVDEGCHQS
jgi:hypothetical protein